MPGLGPRILPGHIRSHEAAARLGISYWRLYGLILRGQYKPRMSGGFYQIPEGHLDALSRTILWGEPLDIEKKKERAK